MNNRDSSYEFWRASILETVDHLRQEILQAPREINKPCEALTMAYEMLTDEQKIAFILAGGAVSLSQWQQHSTEQERARFDTQTGQLPVLC
jgi:hypothetical protein